MKIKAYAKINLALDVIRKREDGYHDLQMIMAPITLHDLIYVNVIDKGIIIDSNSAIMPKDERNIMYKAAKLMQDKYNIKKGIKIYIYKHIPTQAGLGGGSADGAAIFHAMNKFFKLGLSNETLADLSKEIGADIPFCIHNKIAFVEGIGEKLNFIDTDIELDMILVKPKKGVSTKQAFQNIDFSASRSSDFDTLINSLQTNDYNGVVKSLNNSLELPAMNMVKEIKEIKEELIALGFDGCLMSGSGSTVFGITKNKELINEAYNIFRHKRFYVRKTQLLNEKI